MLTLETVLLHFYAEIVRAKGSLEATIKMIKEMFKNNIPIQTIANVAHLSVEETEKIISDNTNCMRFDPGTAALQYRDLFISYILFYKRIWLIYETTGLCEILAEKTRNYVKILLDNIRIM